MDLLCVDHLTDAEPTEVAAVTLLNGNAVCASCAKDRMKALEDFSNHQPQIPELPQMPRFR